MKLEIAKSMIRRAVPSELTGRLGMDCHKQAREYFDHYIDDTGWMVANIKVHGIGKIDGQLKGGVPGLAENGILEIARSDMSERYLLDVGKGHVMQYASYHLAHFMGRVTLGGEQLRKMLKADAEYVFPHLLHLFLCFEDLAGDEYSDQPLRRLIESRGEAGEFAEGDNV